MAPKETAIQTLNNITAICGNAVGASEIEGLNLQTVLAKVISNLETEVDVLKGLLS